MAACSRSQQTVLAYSLQDVLNEGFVAYLLGLLLSSFITATSSSLVSELTYYASSGTLNPAHSLTFSSVHARMICRCLGNRARQQVQILNSYISQGSVATRLRYGGNNFANFLDRITMT